MESAGRGVLLGRVRGWGGSGGSVRDPGERGQGGVGGGCVRCAGQGGACGWGGRSLNGK